MRNLETLLEALAPRLAELEAERVRCRKASFTYAMVLVVPLVIGILGALAAGEDMKIYFIIGSVVWLAFGFVLYSVKAGSLSGRYRAAYKAAVVPKLLGLIDANLRHDAGGGIGEGTFEATELFSTSPDRYSSEDLIEGAFGKTFLQLAEVHAEERRTSTDSKGNTKTTYVTIFRGLLLIADFNKHFQGRTFLFPDVAENLFGDFGRFFQKLGGRSETGLIRLEDPEFESAFAVYATDEIEARYILSTALMRRLLSLKERFGRDLLVAFKESSVAIAVPHSEQFLEPAMSRPATDPGQVRGFLFELDAFLRIVEELDLNTRIWTKE